MPEFFSSVLTTLGVPTIVSIIVAYFTARSQKVNSRSTKTNELRFEKEVESIERLSKRLLDLWHKTALLEQATDKQSADITWYESYSRALDALGKSAPFLNYLDIARKRKGNKGGCGVINSCGVHYETEEKRWRKRAGVKTYSEQSEGSPDLDCIQEKEAKCPDSCPSDNSRKSNSGHPKSLYLRGIEFLDICMNRRNEILACQGIDNENSFLIWGEGAKFRTGNMTSTCSPKINLSTSADEDLNDRYIKFTNCAFCRLYHCDKGKVQTRKAIRKASWRQWRERNIPLIGRYNPECVYENVRDKQQHI